MVFYGSSHRLTSGERQMQETLLVGTSQAIETVRSQIHTAVRTPSVPVVVQGDSGTGKTASARELHRLTGLPDEALVVVDAVLSEDPVRLSEVLRSRIDDKPCTVLVEDLSDLPEKAQAVLALLLDHSRQHQFHRATRWVFTSRQPISALLRRNRLRQDLYYRLGTYVVELPRLTARLADIPILAQHFIDTLRFRDESTVVEPAPEVLGILQSYPWPGNVRELENAMHFGCAVARRLTLLPSDLPPFLQLLSPPTPPLVAEDTQAKGDSLRETVQAFERDLIERALVRANGNIAQAARDMKTTQRILGYKIKTYKISARHAPVQAVFRAMRRGASDTQAG
jgi:Nif-specific regulatory protein